MADTACWYGFGWLPLTLCRLTPLKQFFPVHSLLCVGKAIQVVSECHTYLTQESGEGLAGTTMPQTSPRAYTFVKSIPMIRFDPIKPCSRSAQTTSSMVENWSGIGFHSTASPEACMSSPTLPGGGPEPDPIRPTMFAIELFRFTGPRFPDAAAALVPLLACFGFEDPPPMTSESVRARRVLPNEVNTGVAVRVTRGVHALRTRSQGARGHSFTSTVGECNLETLRKRGINAKFPNKMCSRVPLL